MRSLTTFHVSLIKIITFSTIPTHAARKAAKKEKEPPLRLLDDLFRKTKATPCIYWLPLTPEQVRQIFSEI